MDIHVRRMAKCRMDIHVRRMAECRMDIHVRRMAKCRMDIHVRRMANISDMNVQATGIAANLFLSFGAPAAL